MEARLGADFSDVRVHTDGAARASAAEVGARAYTSGSHVVIGDGGADKHTLAHELTHVIQQRQGPVAGTDHGSGLKVSDPFDAYEQAAEANAARVMRAPLSQHRLTAAGTGEQCTPAVHPLQPAEKIKQHQPTETTSGAQQPEIEPPSPPGVFQRTIVNTHDHLTDELIAKHAEDPYWVPGWTNALEQVAEQHRLGNRAVQRMLEEQDHGSDTKLFDDYLGSYVNVVEHLDTGGERWVVIYQEAERSLWLHRPQDNGYWRLGRGIDRTAWPPGAFEQMARQQINTVIVEDEDNRQWAFLDAVADAKPVPPDADQWQNSVRSQLEKKMSAALEKIGAPTDELQHRISTAFIALSGALQDKLQGPSTAPALPVLSATPDLQAKINEVADPVIKEKIRTEKDAQRVSQALSELEYAVIVLENHSLSRPFVLGAKGPFRHPNQKTRPVMEGAHATLPPLGVANLEADAYYLSGGVLHVDEVKDTPGALADKVKDGGQVGRQVEWLNKLTVIDDVPVRKRVSYWARATRPKFDSVLSEAVVDNLGQIARLNTGEGPMLGSGLTR